MADAGAMARGWLVGAAGYDAVPIRVLLWPTNQNGSSGASALSASATPHQAEARAEIDGISDRGLCPRLCILDGKQLRNADEAISKSSRV